MASRLSAMLIAYSQAECKLFIMAITTKPISLLADASQRFLSFWQWWTQELSATVPKRVSMAFAGDASLTDLMIEDAALVRVRVGADNAFVQELKRIPLPSRDAAAVRAALDELLRGEGRDVRVLVSPENVLRKRISLPMATEENLLDVVGFDMDRQTPFTATQVYFGAQVVSRDVTRERIEVEVVAVPKNILLPWLNEMRAAAISVHSIVAADDFSLGSKLGDKTGDGQGLRRGAPPIELLPTSAGPTRRWSNMQRINVGLILLAVALALVAVLLPIWQKREMVKELMPVAAKADSEFKITQRVTEEYTRLASEYNYVVGRKHANYPTVMLVDEITKISPDTMWIQSFEYKALAKTRELQLAGEAASVSKVIESLEQTPFLQNTTQRQQTRQGSRPNIEYFTLASEVKPRPLPEAIVVGTLAVTQARQDSPAAGVMPLPNMPVAPAAPAAPASPTAPTGTPPVAAPVVPPITTPLKSPPVAVGGANLPVMGAPPAANALVTPATIPNSARTPTPPPGAGNSPTPIPFPPLSQTAPLMPTPPPASPNNATPSVPMPLPNAPSVPNSKAQTP